MMPNGYWENGGNYPGLSREQYYVELTDKIGSYHEYKQYEGDTSYFWADAGGPPTRTVVAMVFYCDVEDKDVPDRLDEIIQAVQKWKTSLINSELTGNEPMLSRTERLPHEQDEAQAKQKR